MTERLYYKDSKLVDFDAIVSGIKQESGKFHVSLDRTAFYPDSGGQLHDTGSINGHSVINVIETTSSEVIHVMDEFPYSEGLKVHGVVDTNRRLRHRQQHTAQHILSQVLIQLFDLETKSVHLGEEYGAIELEVESLSPDQLSHAETKANEIITQNLPVEVIFASKDDLSKIPLRKQPDREGTIRVIRIGDFDWSACGGTHCYSTAEVGIIKVIGIEKMRGHILVRFLSGQQALEDYIARFEVTDQLAKTFTCHINDLVSKIDKLSNENRAQRKEIGALQKELLPARVAQIALQTETNGKQNVVIVSNPGVDSSNINQLATMVAQEISGIAVIFSEGKLIIATAETTGLKAGQLARQFSEKTGLKGGGNDRIIQFGGAESNRLAEYRDIFLTLADNA